MFFPFKIKIEVVFKKLCFGKNKVKFHHIMRKNDKSSKQLNSFGEMQQKESPSQSKQQVNSCWKVVRGR